MASTFNSVKTPYANATLSTTATLAFAAGGEVRSGVIIANNSASGSGDLHVIIQDDFGSAPGSMTNPTLKISAGNSVQIACNTGVAIWLAASTGTVIAKVTPVQS